MIKVVVFDFDGVLADSLQAHLDFCKHLSGQGRKDNPGSKFSEMLHISSPDEFKQRVARRNHVISPMNNFFAAMGLPEDEIPEAVNRYADEFNKYDYGLYEAVDDSLRLLVRAAQKSGFKLALLSANKIQNILNKLGGLADHFSVIVTHGQPNAETASTQVVKEVESTAHKAVNHLVCAKKNNGLRMIAHSLGHKLEELLYVGDQHSDYEAAQSVDCEFLGVAYGWMIDKTDNYMAIVEQPEQLAQSVLNRVQPAATSLQELTLLLKHGRTLFVYHAGQRLNSIRFNMAGQIAVFAGYGWVFSGPSSVDANTLLGFSVALIGAIITLSFWLLDNRNHELVDLDEKLLKAVEHQLSKSTGIDEARITEATHPMSAGRFHPTYGKIMFITFSVFLGTHSLAMIIFGLRSLT